MKTMPLIFLSAVFPSWREPLEKDDFRNFLDTMGARVLAKNSRRTVEVFSWKDKRYFFKWHHRPKDKGLGLREWQWTCRIQALGISVPKIAAAGENFFISEEISDAMSLESLWEGRGQAAMRFPRSLVRAVATVVSTLHKANVAHKDLYLGHFFYDSVTGRMSLIDMARARHHRWFFLRWRVKDLASLFFSSSLLNVPTRDKIFFFHAYLGRKKLRLGDRMLAFWIERKAGRIARHTRRALGKREELRQATPHNSLNRVLPIS